MNNRLKILLSTTYLGPIEYYVQFLRADRIIIEQEEHYSKQTYRNRCQILTANGVLSLVIPVIKVYGNHTKIKDIEISYTEKWQQNHWRAIETAYSNSPYFLYYQDELFTFYQEKFKTLLEFNNQLTELILNLIEVDKKIEFTDQYIADHNELNDLRNVYSPKKKSLIICPTYIQVFNDRFGFVPNLSIVDLLFNLGPESKSYLEKIP